MPIQFVDPPGLPPSPGYSHVTITTAGRHAFVSGQVSVDRHGEVVGKGDLRRQVNQTFVNLRAALEAAGARVDQVAKMVAYVVQLTPQTAAIVRSTRAEFFGAHHPASTMVGVTGLVHPDLLIEIEADALLDP